MPQPVSPHIVSTPSAPYQQYDATDTGTVDAWDKLTEASGPVSLDSGRPEGDFPSSGAWKQV
jgi:hypothetical protein